MPRNSRWSELLPGIVGVVAIVAGAAAVLLFAQVGTIHGDKFRLYATVQQATGLSSGSEVWVAGEAVGVVDDIGYLPPSSDTAQRLILTLDILERARPVIRRGSEVRIRPGGSVVGAPVVAIEIGRPGQATVSENDTLRAPPETDMERVKGEFQSATGEVPMVLTNMRLLSAQLRAAQGTLGALGIEGSTRITSTGAVASRLMTTFRSSRGSVGRLMGRRGNEASRYVLETLARVDTLKRLVTAPPAVQSLGRFRRDSTIFQQVATLQADLDTIAAALALPAGTAGRLQHDEALAQEVAEVRAQLAALVADMKRHPLRYLAF